MLSLPSSFPTSTAIAVLGTLAGAGITGLFTYLTTRTQEKHKDRRRVAEFYLEQKVEILTEFHDFVSRAHTIAMHGIQLPDEDFDGEHLPGDLTEDEVEELETLLEQIVKMHQSLFVYLDQSEREQVLDGMTNKE